METATFEDNSFLQRIPRLFVSGITWALLLFFALGNLIYMCAYIFLRLYDSDSDLIIYLFFVDFGVRIRFSLIFFFFSFGDFSFWVMSFFPLRY